MGHRAELYALELALARRQVDEIPGGYEAVLDDAFLEFGASGLTWGRAATLDMLGAEAVSAAFDIEDFTADKLADGVVLVTYTGIVHRHDGSRVRSRRSSVWIHRGGRWRLRFHQGTTVPEGMA